MKIVFLVDGLIMGGLETHVATFTNELLRRGHQVLIHSMRTDPFFFTQIDSHSCRFHHVTGTDDPVSDVRFFRPDIVHAHPFYAVQRGYQISKAFKKPLIVTMHGLYDSGLDHSPTGLEISEGISRIIAVDLGVAALLLSCAPHPEKISVIRNGMDLIKFYPLTENPIDLASVGLVPEWLTMVAVTRFADRKEQVIFKLLDLAPLLAEQLGGLNLLLVGDGRYYSEIDEAAHSVMQATNSVRIVMAGRQSDVRPYLALGDLVVACGRAALEAMACQRPVFVAYQTGFAGALDSSTFEILFDLRGYYHTLTQEETLEQLLVLLKDNNQRDQMARNGLDIIRQHYDIVTTTDQLERIYKQYL